MKDMKMNPNHLYKATRSKSSLAVSLSHLKSFEHPKMKLEQYSTDSEVAAGALWNASLLGDIDGKVIADLGCGTGILGIGALILGAKKVYFVDIDKSVLETLKLNLDDFGIEEDFEIVNCEISKFKQDVDVIIQNPPFGTKEEHADREFLQAAFSLSDVVYSFHKSSTKKFISAIAVDSGFSITHEWDFLFPLKNTMDFHTKKMQRIEVTCFRLENNKRKE